MDFHFFGHVGKTLKCYKVCCNYEEETCLTAADPNHCLSMLELPFWALWNVINTFQVHKTVANGDVELRVRT